MLFKPTAPSFNKRELNVIHSYVCLEGEDQPKSKQNKHTVGSGWGKFVGFLKLK